MADMIGQTHVTLSVDEGPALGAALLAAVGTGAYSSVPEACAATIRTVEETAPNPDTQAIYDKYHPLYQSLYPALKQAFVEAARLAG